MLKSLPYWSSVLRNTARNAVLRATNKLPELEYIVYEVTDACNSRCKHCNIWKNKPTKDILSPQEIGNMFANKLFRNVKTVLLTGGEPIMRPDMKEVIDAIHKSLPRAKITISTNGLMPERILDVLNHAVANGVCLSVGISLDGVGEKHDAVRGVKGSFEKTDYLIKECLKLKGKYGSKMGELVTGHTISSLTYDTLKDVTAYAKGLNVPCLTQLYEEFSFYHNLEDAKNEKVQNYQQAENKEMINEIKKLPVTFHNETLLYALKHKLKYRCASMRSFALLRCNGDIAPCLQYSHVCAGNVRNQKPDELWNDQSARKARNLVDSCQGCSNSWATGWSFEKWFFSFLGMVIGFKLKQIFKNPKKN